MHRRQFLLCAALMIGSRAAAGDEALWAALRAGGVAMLLRHAATDPGIGDPADFRLGDCGSQRNLSAAGRAQAVRLGQALTERAIRIDAVWSSQWCRCIDTARLAFPNQRVEPLAALNSFFADRSTEPQQTAAVRARLNDLEAGANVALVTHQVNITALTGESVNAGEAIFVRRSAGLQRIGRFHLP